MADELLLDTGALVSLLDRSQRGHAQCAKFLAEWDRPVVSSEAVLTEATHLLGHQGGGPEACAELGTHLVFTTDRGDFTVYRIHGRRRFQILPP